jgi:hypothetical protein
MKESYRPDLKAHVLTDEANRVRAIRHTGDYWESPTGGGMMTAVAYLRHFESVYEIPAKKLDRLVRSEDTPQSGVDAKMPSKETIDRFRKVFTSANTLAVQRHQRVADRLVLRNSLKKQ